MKKYLLAALAVSALSATSALAQDASEQKPVAPAATQTAPPQNPETPPVAPVVVPPPEAKNAPRDAITGQPVTDAENPMKKVPEKGSLRDQVRSQMKD